MTVDLSEFKSDSCGQKPKIGLILEKLDEEHREKLEAALADHNISDRTISRVLDKWGHPISSGAVRLWRERHARS